MNANDILAQMKDIQNKLLDFIDNEDNEEENFQNLNSVIDDIEIRNNSHKLSTLLRLLIKLSNNHHRCNNFYSKIEKIIQLFKEQITSYFSNLDIFNIFKSNKRLLLFLNEEKILTFDEQIVNQITNIKYVNQLYLQYFAPEIGPFLNKITDNSLKKDIEKYNTELPENFYENRKNGENEDVICQYIQKDLIKEFISHVNKNSISLKSKIKKSIYETNSFLLKKQAEKNNRYYYNFNDKDSISLIEYATFYGSIQIFNYLKLEGVELTPSLWIYAVHGINPEIIHVLEENNIKPEEKTYDKCLLESIKCHHNDVANYIQSNLMQSDDKKTSFCIKNSNFAFIENNDFADIFPYLCKYDYYDLVDNLLKTNAIDLNKQLITESGSKTPLYCAVEKQNLDIIKLLLSCDEIDINIINKEIKKKERHEIKSIEKTALYLAVEKENFEIIKLLLADENIDINIYNSIYEKKTENSRQYPFSRLTALYTAIDKSNLQIVKLLLENDDIDVNIRNKTSYKCEETLLYLAVKKKSIEIVKLLLKKKDIDINITSKSDNYHVINHYF